MVDPGSSRLFYQCLRLQTRMSRYTGVKIPRDRGYSGVNYGLVVCAASVAYKKALSPLIQMYCYRLQHLKHVAFKFKTQSCGVRLWQ